MTLDALYVHPLRLAIYSLAVTSIFTVVTGEPKPAARLVGGENPWSGRLEVYFKRQRAYGTVCDDGWNMNASHVACRMLGYADAVNYHFSNVFGAGEGTIVLDDVRCAGDEPSLFKCQRAKLGVSNCHHSEDIGLTCSQDTIQERMEARRAAERKQIKARLVGRSKLRPISEGVVELFYKGKWRTVCGEGWDTQDSRVVCGMLGFKDSLPLNEGYEESKDFKRPKSMRFSNFQCTGSEVIIGTCPFDDLEDAEDCLSDAVAHARCHRGDFVLDTPYDESGEPLESTAEESDEQAAEQPVEVVSAGDEGDTSTDSGGDQWMNTTATLPEADMPATEAPEVLNDDTEQAQRRKGRNKKPAKKQAAPRVWKQKPTIRLKSGANYGEGRVEVHVNGYWGTVCSEGWDEVSASVACRQLGFGVAKEAIPNSEFGQGVGPIWLWRVRCEGHEKTLLDCSHGYLNGSRCTHAQDASVRCVVPDIDAASKVRLEGGTYEREGRVAVYVNGEWGNICGANWGLLAGKVVCRQLGMGHARYAPESTLSYGSAAKRNFLMLDVQCTGNERTIKECKYTRPSNTDTCIRAFRAGVVCVDTLPDILMDLHILQSSVRVQDWPESLMTCAREEGCLSDVPNNWGLRRLLRFTSAIMNRGMEQFRPFLSRYSWIWHSCHRHFHSMEVFSHYDLINRKGERVAQGHKASFCLEDGHCDDGVSPQFSCNTDQGISVNCIDIYASNIDCQWVDITGVRTDLYTLRIHINPDNLVAESDYENNLIECDLYYGRTITIGHCEYVTDRMTN
ncbi:lysyl oxidase homolog 4-like isoform X2 [Acanthaster planci]|uniref:Lysyl oxidase homolog 4-like isoform X2 n=1 Tax=Acanthaster planci TaxID=133434 RepID=A0A8B7YGD6_ACAPL|nr:lysyl oxidase homolog 4-like isoform X2 [Acanthaster planci]